MRDREAKAGLALPLFQQQRLKLAQACRPREMTGRPCVAIR